MQNVHPQKSAPPPRPDNRAAARPLRKKLVHFAPDPADTHAEQEKPSCFGFRRAPDPTAHTRDLPVSIVVSRERVRRWGAVVAAAAWLAVVGLGMNVLLDEQTRAGAPAHPPASWPVVTRLALAPEGPTLLVFAHPRCACTRATMAELDRLLARVPGKVATTIVLVLPEGSDAAWGRGAIAHAAAAIQGARVVTDPDGAEARRFGALTSGQALLYGRDGSLEFVGGITPGRAHEGANAGSDAIVAAVAHGMAPRAMTAVFGCALSAPARESL